MIRHVKGDATQPVGEGLKIITHVCNNVGGWGSGFVVALSDQFGKDDWSPEGEYRYWHEKARHLPNRGDMVPFELGNVQFVHVGKDLIVANMIAQNSTVALAPWPQLPPIRYEALELCLAKVGDYVDKHGGTVHMPRIGCGLAGGTWSRVGPIVEDTLEGIAVTVYDFA